MYLITGIWQRFQPALPRRKRHFNVDGNVWDLIFQPTLPRRKRRQITSIQADIIRFQPTLPRRKRLFRLTLGQSGPKFQPTLPRRKRLRHSSMFHVFVYFNPRFHAGSDLKKPLNLVIPEISTHASTQEATLHILFCHGCRILFQPTLPRRKRPNAAWLYVFQSYISTHASTQEATICGRILHGNSLNFNPRFHAGSDCNYQQI